MSLPDILKELQSIKDDLKEIKEVLNSFQEKNEKIMEKHSAVIIAGVKTHESHFKQNIPRTMLGIFERRGEPPPPKEGFKEGKFDINFLS